MVNSFRNSAIGVGVGALVVAAATPSMALPNLPTGGNHDQAHGYTARPYGYPYGGYAYAPDPRYCSWVETDLFTLWSANRPPAVRCGVRRRSL